VTRTEAIAIVRRLAAGLDASDSSVRKLLERISVHDDAEALRDALVEAGAQAVLEEA
jgi:hypothetical protein